MSPGRNRAAPSVGIYWGADAADPPTRLPTLVPPPPPPPPPPPAPARSLRDPNRSRVPPPSLPVLPGARRDDTTTEPPSASPTRAATHSLLSVLRTLWQSIRDDASKFATEQVGQLVPGPARAGVLSFEERFPGVYVEDRAFFHHAKERELQQETAQIQTIVARRLHCAASDTHVVYPCDRRTRQPTRRRRRPHRNRGHGRDETTAAASERVRIDRQTRKIAHLLHVLQEEIAHETTREIHLIECSSPTRTGMPPSSRQSRRRWCELLRARYEAADRIMRILEEYRIVVGVEAAEYLRQTIRDGQRVLARG